MGAGTGGDPEKKHICSGIKQNGEKTHKSKKTVTNERSFKFRRVKEGGGGNVRADKVYCRPSLNSPLQAGKRNPIPPALHTRWPLGLVINFFFQVLF